jgi:hypothetical protein
VRPGAEGQPNSIAGGDRRLDGIACEYRRSVARVASGMLTLQTCVGLLPTLVSIQLVASVSQAMGWPAAFTMLARMRENPDATRLAGGRR